MHVHNAPVTHCDNREEAAAATSTRGGDHVKAYTVEQVADMLSIGRDKVYYLLRTGQLRSIKIGKLRRITSQHLAELISSLENNRT
jgi:excisionase family DNA binding protein